MTLCSEGFAEFQLNNMRASIASPLRGASVIALKDEIGSCMRATRPSGPVVIDLTAQLLYGDIHKSRSVALFIRRRGNRTASLAPSQPNIFFIGVPTNFDGALIDIQRAIFGSVGRQLMKQRGKTVGRPLANR
jgi:hypothetical protein